MDLSKSLYRIAESAFGMLRNDECGFTEEEERIVQRNLLYWMERKHHFDEQLGRACIANIYYFDDDVHKKYAPYFGFDELKDDYDRLSWNIPDYNFWDFAVTMNKMYADHIDVVANGRRTKILPEKGFRNWLSVSSVTNRQTTLQIKSGGT